MTPPHGSLDFIVLEAPCPDSMYWKEFTLEPGVLGCPVKPLLDCPARFMLSCSLNCWSTCYSILVSSTSGAEMESGSTTMVGSCWT